MTLSQPPESSNITSDLRRLFKGTFYILASIVVMKIATTAGSIVLARMLGPKNLGVVTILDTFLVNLLLIASFGVPAALTKYLAEYTVRCKERIPALLLSGASVVILTTAALFIGLLATRKLVSGFYREPQITGLLIIIAFNLVFLSLIDSGSAVLRGFQKIRSLSFLNPMKPASMLILAVPLIALFGITGALLAGLLSSMVSFIFLLFLLYRHTTIRISTFQHVRRFDFGLLSKYGVPAVLSSILGSLPIWAAMTVLSIKVDFQQVGLLRVANSLAQLPLFIPWGISIPLVPLVAELEQLERGRLTDLFHKAFKLNALIMLVVTAYLLLSSRLVIPIFFGSDYASAWQVLFFLGAGAYLSSVNAVVGFLIAGTGRMWQGCLLNLIWAIIFMVSSYLLMTRIGLLGFGIAYLISYSLHTVTSLCYLRISYRIAVRNLQVVLGLPTLLFAVTYLALHYWPISGSARLATGLLAIALPAILWVSLSPQEKDFVRHALRRCIH